MPTLHRAVNLLAGGLLVRQGKRRLAFDLRRLGVRSCGTLARAVALTLLVSPPLLAQPSPRMNLQDFIQDPARVEALKRGVAVMKARQPSDPLSWFFQAAIHGVTPEAVQDALDQDPNVATVDQGRFWNQCPHNGQPSADFVIWHRAYTYYFERILREATGDPTFSLPYWDYTQAGQRTFPQLFGDPERDPQTFEPTNPLFDAERELAFMFGLYELTSGAVSPARAFLETDFFGADEASGFAGGVGDLNPRTIGRLEAQPHNLIHVAIGGIIGDNAGAMADVPTAAFDPVFWVHHTNIDRLWSVWECLPGRDWGTVPPQSYFDEKPWFFHDANGTVTNHSRLEYLTPGTLPVQYDTDDPSCTPLSQTPPDPPSPIIEAAVVPVEREEAGVFPETVSFSATEPVRLSVSLAQDGLFGEDSVLSALESATASRPRRLILELRGLDYDAPPSVGFGVYVNLPEGAEPDPESTHFVGLLTLFGLTHHHDGHGEALQTFDITHLATMPGFDPDTLTVTVAPFDLLLATPGFPPLRRSGRLQATAIAVLVEEG